MQPGARLGPYEIVIPLGAGGMGEVYRARDTRLGRDVAIKLLRSEVIGNPDRVKRFEHEARTVASLSHPNILALFDVGTHEGRPYLVTELLEGQTLAERIRSGDITVARAVELATQIAQGLAAAHEKGIIHRDLKPANVFVTNGGVIKILDFGLARLAQVESGVWDREGASTQTDLTSEGSILGTVGYMAPEQVRGLPADHRSDIFALGCVLYEMLSGQRAFKGATPADTLSAILKEDPPPLSGLRQSVSPALQEIIDRCLEKRPEERFSSAHDLGLALGAVASGSGTWRRLDAVPGARVGGRRGAGPARLASALGRLSSTVRPRRWLWLLGGVAVIAAVLVGSSSLAHYRRLAWARDEALPELARLASDRQYWPAFLLARRIAAVVPDDPTLQTLRPRFACEFKRQLEPPGSKLLARPRNGGEGDWFELGEPGSAPVLAPLGYSVFRVQHPGFEPREFAMTVDELDWDEGARLGKVVLARQGELPDGMVRVESPPEKVPLGFQSSNFEIAAEEQIPSFYVDAHEVTNREYKRFVDAGGYRRREFWKESFERDGSALSWEEAMALLRDATGQPGPAGWEVSNYPQGRDDEPVTGVSWYEAAAYAVFASKRLPSVYHWVRASNPWMSGDFVPGSNFSGSLAPVGSYRGSLNYWGVFDVAGNAREWCSNPSGSDRLALGGGCDGPAYMFWNPEPKPPFDRNPTTGFRCVRPVASDSQDGRVDGSIARRASVDLSAEKPFSDDAWSTWRGLLSYAKGPLDAKVEWTDDSSPSWRIEKVSFTAAYGNERAVAYLFLPRSVQPPWQVVVFWPGGYAPMVSSSGDGREFLDLSYWKYLVTDGRAVLYPILEGTYERGGHVGRVVDPSMAHCILEAKDVFRSLDYLETREDIRSDRIGFLGFSWGAIAGPFVCAVEPRIKVQVLLGGGLYDRDMLGFIHRCSIPTQMVNGRQDGYDQNQAPMFRALATPADQKRHVVFEADHSLQGFQNEIVKVNLEWFDRFLGPVR